MKTIIAGSRSITPKEFKTAIKKCKWSHKISTVVSGGAAGADKLGELWAASAGLKLQIYLPDWESFGKAAGPIRNEEMADNAEALLAIWDGSSRGTISMIELARKKSLRVFVYNVYEDSVQEFLPNEQLFLV